MCFLWLLTQLWCIGTYRTRRLTPTYDPTYLPGQDSPDKDQISKEEISFDPPPKESKLGVEIDQ